MKKAAAKRATARSLIRTAGRKWLTLNLLGVPDGTGCGSFRSVSAAIPVCLVVLIGCLTSCGETRRGNGSVDGPGEAAVPQERVSSTPVSIQQATAVELIPTEGRLNRKELVALLEQDFKGTVGMLEVLAGRGSLCGENLESAFRQVSFHDQCRVRDALRLFDLLDAASKSRCSELMIRLAVERDGLPAALEVYDSLPPGRSRTRALEPLLGAVVSTGSANEVLSFIEALEFPEERKRALHTVNGGEWYDGFVGGDPNKASSLLERMFDPALKGEAFKLAASHLGARGAPGTARWFIENAPAVEPADVSDAWGRVVRQPHFPLSELSSLVDHPGIDAQQKRDAFGDRATHYGHRGDPSEFNQFLASISDLPQEDIEALARRVSGPLLRDPAKAIQFGGEVQDARLRDAFFESAAFWTALEIGSVEGNPYLDHIQSDAVRSGVIKKLTDRFALVEKENAGADN